VDASDGRRVDQSYLVAGVERRTALPGCWCASSQSRRTGLVGNHTEWSLHQTYSSLQRQTQQHLVHLTVPVVIDSNELNRMSCNAIWFRLWVYPVKRFLPSCMMLLLCSCACLRLSSSTHHQESELQQSSLKANPDHLWLNHQGLQLIICAHHGGLGTTTCEREVALIQRDAACPRRLAETIKLKWYVACTGNVADGNNVRTTAGILIHRAESNAWLVLIKWLGEIRLRKAPIPSDSSHW